MTSPLLPADQYKNLVGEESADIIVIGSGFAGLMASLRASQAGASVIVVEKLGSCGGNSIISDGAMIATGSALQKKMIRSDSAQKLLTDMLTAGRYSNQQALTKIVADNTANVIDWLLNDLNVSCQKQLFQFGGHSEPRCIVPTKVAGTCIIKPMISELKRRGVVFKTGLQMIGFCRDSSGRVTGVEVLPFPHADQPGQRLMGRKAVILATGGFSADTVFRQQLDSRLTTEIGCTNTPHATAESLQAAINIGCDTVDLEHIQLAPFTSPDEKGYGVSSLFASYTAFPYGMLVNPQSGQRFVNEMSDRKTRVDAMLSLGIPSIGIADKQAIELSGQGIERCLKRNVVIRFDDLTALAEYYQIPFSPLKISLSRYNDFTESGHDVDFHKPISSYAKPLQPPYYAVRLWPKVHYTMGGLRINAQAQVLQTNGEIMKGLYAAGEVTGGIHGHSRLSSAAITECLVFGSIAGQQATREKTTGSLFSHTRQKAKK